MWHCADVVVMDADMWQTWGSVICEARGILGRFFEGAWGLPFTWFWRLWVDWHAIFRTMWSVMWLKRWRGKFQLRKWTCGGGSTSDSGNKGMLEWSNGDGAKQEMAMGAEEHQKDETTNTGRWLWFHVRITRRKKNPREIYGSF